MLGEKTLIFFTGYIVILYPKLSNHVYILKTFLLLQASLRRELFEFRTLDYICSGKF